MINPDYDDYIASKLTDLPAMYPYPQTSPYNEIASAEDLDISSSSSSHDFSNGSHLKYFAEQSSLSLADNYRPKHKNTYILIMFIIFYSLVTVLSLIGNVIILIVLIKRRRMRIVTNFFLANITIANLLYTLCAPLHFINETYGEWIFFDIMCQLLPFLSTLSINLNTFTMIAASLERLVVIVYPFKSKLTKHKCSLIILLIWILAILASLPWIIILHVRYIYLFETIKINIADDEHSWHSLLNNQANHSSDNHTLDAEYLFGANVESSTFTAKNDTNHAFTKQMKTLHTFFSMLTKEEFKRNDIERYLNDNSYLIPSKSIIELKETPIGNLSEYQASGSSSLNSTYDSSYDLTIITSFSSVKACDSVFKNDLVIRTYFLVLCIIQFLLPLSVLCITYIIIAYYVYFINSKIDLNINKYLVRKNKKKLIKLLISIIIGFNICWFPLQLNAFLYAIDPKYVVSSLTEEEFRCVWMAIHLLAFSHFCHNPFVNGLLNKKFKLEIINLFKWRFSKSKKNWFKNEFFIPSKANKSQANPELNNNNNNKNSFATINPNKKNACDMDPNKSLNESRENVETGSIIDNKLLRQINLVKLNKSKNASKHNHPTKNAYIYSLLNYRRGSNHRELAKRKPSQPNKHKYNNKTSETFGAQRRSEFKNSLDKFDSKSLNLIKSHSSSFNNINNQLEINRKKYNLIVNLSQNETPAVKKLDYSLSEIFNRNKLPLNNANSTNHKQANNSSESDSSLFSFKSAKLTTSNKRVRLASSALTDNSRLTDKFRLTKKPKKIVFSFQKANRNEQQSCTLDNKASRSCYTPTAQTESHIFTFKHNNYNKIALNNSDEDNNESQKYVNTAAMTNSMLDLSRLKDKHQSIFSLKILSGLNKSDHMNTKLFRLSSGKACEAEKSGMIHIISPSQVLNETNTGCNLRGDTSTSTPPRSSSISTYSSNNSCSKLKNNFYSTISSSNSNYNTLNSKEQFIKYSNSAEVAEASKKANNQSFLFRTNDAAENHDKLGFRNEIRLDMSNNEAQNKLDESASFRYSLSKRLSASSLNDLDFKQHYNSL